MSRRYLFYSALDNRIGMNDGWPYGILPDKETQLVVGIETVHESSHKATLAWNIQTLWSILLLYQGIKIFLQFWSYQFISINHQYPLAGSSIYGSLTCRFTNLIVSSRKDNYLATITLCYIQGVVSTFHVADNHLVKALHCIQHLLKMAGGIIGINNHRDAISLLLFYTCLIHISMLYKY